MICSAKKTISRFTLLEMTLSIFIFSIIMLILGTALATAQQSLNKVTQKNQSLMALQTLDRVFTSSLRNAVPFSWTDAARRVRTVFVGEPNKVSFAYLHRVSDSNEGGIRFIQFYQAADKLMVAYRKAPILPWDQNTFNLAEKEVLCDNVSSINMNYAARFNNQIVWKNSWQTEDGKFDIPLAIQIKINFRNGESQQWLRRTAGAGQFEEFKI